MRTLGDPIRFTATSVPDPVGGQGLCRRSSGRRATVLQPALACPSVACTGSCALGLLLLVEGGDLAGQGNDGTVDRHVDVFRVDIDAAMKSRVDVGLYAPVLGSVAKRGIAAVPCPVVVVRGT